MLKKIKCHISIASPYESYGCDKIEKKKIKNSYEYGLSLPFYLFIYFFHTGYDLSFTSNIYPYE